MKKFSAPAASGGLGQALADGLVVTWRSLKRIPKLAIFAMSWVGV